ncbi:MAG TPA: hypothetical protein VFW96_14570 [Thermomicrobiales bacterium]|nr:hypothetical protein [Thermomicrobiales bacterium]
MMGHELAAGAPFIARDSTSSRAASRRVLTVAWALLLLLGAFYLFAPLADLARDIGAGLPADHAGTFSAVAGATWASAAQSAPGLTSYVTLLEVAYAVHELVFGILFLVILAIPFRRRSRWAWWACWTPMLANVAYSLTFGRHDPTILYRSLVADIALPLLLVIHIPAFFRRAERP